MGKIIPMVREFTRITYIDASGKKIPVDLDVTGPTVEAEKSLAWARSQIEKDGGKVIDARIGTKQNGEFIERQARPVPLIVNGYRRMSAFLRG